ncbi:MAG: S8 family serine peptidase [Prevotella sp.]|nr:S8 family serine peptidase [Prevotella sp.]
MKLLYRTLAVVVFAMLATSTWAVEEHKAYPGGPCHLYRLQLKDKKGSPYSLSKPEEFLSMKSLERRRRQGLSIDSTDLPISERYLSKLRQLGLKVVSKSKWNNTVVVALPQPDDLRTLADIPFVTDVTHLFSAPDSVDISSRDELIPQNLENLPVDSRVQMSMLHVDQLHEVGYRGKGMTIAIIDGGFMNVDRIPLLSNVSVVAQRDCVYPPSPDFYGELDHGTMVLSTIAMNRPDTMVGMAPEAHFVLIRTEDGRSESLAEEDFWAAAAEYADSIGVDLINSSLGYHHFDRSLGDHPYRELDGQTSICSRSAALLASKGIVLVASAGNEGLGTWKKINVPGDADNILTVGAVNQQLMNTGFSSVGPSADGRVKPDVMAMGYHSAVVSGKGTLTTANGTSFSAPITCGAVACLWQALPNLTALQMIDLVRSSGDRFEYPDNVFGYGIPDYWKAFEKARTSIDYYMRWEDLDD